MFSAATKDQKFALCSGEAAGPKKLVGDGLFAISSFSIGSITAYIFTIAMKSGSCGIDEIVPVGTAKCCSAANTLSFTYLSNFGHHTSKGSRSGEAVGVFAMAIEAGWQAKRDSVP